MKTRKPRRRRGGFTLLEVLLVLAILVILASAVTFSIVRMQKSGYQKAARLQISAYEQAAEAYHIDIGDYPPDLNSLQQAPPDLQDVNKWKGPYLKGQIQTDPWGVEYSYQTDGEAVRISSSGPDKIEGNEDDVSNI